VETLTHVRFIDAHDGSTVFVHDNIQSSRRRETYHTDHCTQVPGILWIDESGLLPGYPIDDIAKHAYLLSGLTYDYYWNNFGRDGPDDRGGPMRSLVHGGVYIIFGCSQNNAAFYPKWNVVMFGDGDGELFSPLGMALDVVAHEWTHAVVWWSITWPDGSPRGLDYHDEPGALNESYADFFGALIEGRNWLCAEDCYTPNIPGDGLRNLEYPRRYGMPDHYKDYVSTGSQGWKVHHNMSIVDKAGQLMCDGGTHYGIQVEPLGKQNTAQIWYRALTHYLPGHASFSDARSAMLLACTELFVGDGAAYDTVANAFDAVGVY